MRDDKKVSQARGAAGYNEPVSQSPRPRQQPGSRSSQARQRSQYRSKTLESSGHNSSTVSSAGRPRWPVPPMKCIESLGTVMYGSKNKTAHRAMKLQNAVASAEQKIYSKIMELKRSSPYSFRHESGPKEKQKRPVQIGANMIRMKMKVRDSHALMTQQSTDTGRAPATAPSWAAKPRSLATTKRSPEALKRRGRRG